MKKQKGFTLIELTIVIIVLGVLAAFAIPKYMDLDKKARIASVKGLAGSIRSAATLVHSVAMTARGLGESITDSVNIGTENIELKSSTVQYPNASAADITAALADISGFSAQEPANNSIAYHKDGASTSADCSVTYNINGTTPNVTVTNTGC